LTVTRVLLTAFDVYDRWVDNSSWLALVDLTSWYDGELDITTRRYPVDLTKMREQLEKDLGHNFDFAIHLGQSPGTSVIKLESVGLNLRSNGQPLIADAPMAYRSQLDLEACQQRLAESGIPSVISHHAGTYLCNAVFYLSHHFSEMMGRRTQSVFVHIPLTPAQVAQTKELLPSMSTPMASMAVALLAEQLSNDDS
jgi:pyroglutamyl-peptidase